MQPAIESLIDDERVCLNLPPPGGWTSLHLMHSSCWCNPEVSWLDDDTDLVEHQ